MSDIFDHAEDAGAYPLDMHYTPFVPEASSKPANKLVYLVSKTERCITMACVYDDWGIIYAIQL